MTSPKPLCLLITLGVLAGVLEGCAVGPSPENHRDSAWMAQEAPGADLAGCHAARPPEGWAQASFRPSGELARRAPVLAPGDRIRVRVPGDEDRVTGAYVIDDAGRLLIDGLEPFQVAGLSLQDAKSRLGAAMVGAGVVRPLREPVDVKLLESASIAVAVAGAVFNVGTTRVGERSAESRAALREAQTTGDANPERTISTALRAAGGVRPDADITHVYLLRGEHWTTIDLSGAVSGAMAEDATLAAGDRIFVPSNGCFHADLVRPTAVTAPGIRVFMSNLTRPAASNASSAVGRDATSLPYGTRMIQGLVSMNCIGGSVMNAHRKAVLISRNPITLRSVVIERDVERLVRDGARDGSDPYLMPGDAMACYDSRLMNFQDALGLITSTLGAGANGALISNLARK